MDQLILIIQTRDPVMFFPTNTDKLSLSVRYGYDRTLIFCNFYVPRSFLISLAVTHIYTLFVKTSI